MKTFALKKKPVPYIGKSNNRLHSSLPHNGNKHTDIRQILLSPQIRSKSENYDSISINRDNNISGNHLIPRTAGNPLPCTERAFFESRFGTDLGDVRIHQGNESANSAKAINASAYTINKNIVFGKDRYNPGNESGQRLLAHELTHVIQQKKASNTLSGKTIQREPNKKDEVPAQITAKEIFPYPKGKKMILSKSIDDSLLNVLSGFPKAKGMVDTLRAIDSQEATVKTATDDLFEAVIAGPVSLPGVDKKPGRSLTNITLKLERDKKGVFDFNITATENNAKVTLFGKSDLTAKKIDDSIMLYTGTGKDLKPLLQVSKRKKGKVSLKAYTASFLSGIPKKFHSYIPKSLDFMEISPLSKKATPMEKKKIIEKAKSKTRVKKHRFDFGAGYGNTDTHRLLLTTSWQMKFPSTKIISWFGGDSKLANSLGNLLQTTVEVQALYMPNSSIIGKASIGAELSLFPVEIPLLIRFMPIGFAGGTVELPSTEIPGQTEHKAIAGLTMGFGIGTKVWDIPISLRYEHIFSVIKKVPDVNALFLTGGYTF